MVENFPPMQWSAPEYEERERTRDWFWALGIIVATASLASIIFGNYFFAGLIVLGGIVLGLFATKTPETVPYELNSRGLKIRMNLYSFDSIQAFWVEMHAKPTLFIKSSRFFMPMIAVPIDPLSAPRIHEIMMSKGIPEEEMKEHLSEKIMDALGF
jgi:hypothetical protein